LAQRLVRRICNGCKELYEINAVELRRFGFRPTNEGQIVQIARGLGCEACRQTGYRGRIGLFELLVMNAVIANIISKRGPDEAVLEAAKANRMKLLPEDGLVKIFEGITTPQEVLRVLRL